jgi:hypothetical protein
LEDKERSWSLRAWRFNCRREDSCGSGDEDVRACVARRRRRRKRRRTILEC